MSVYREEGKIENLHYMLEGSPEGKAVVVMFHGFPGDVSEYGKFDKVASRLTPELSVVRFYLPGHHKDDNTPITLTKLVDGSEHVINFARNRFDEVGSLGYSMGGYVALKTSKPKTIVLWNPLTAHRENYKVTLQDPMRGDLTLMEDGKTWKYTPKLPVGRPLGAKQVYLIGEQFFEELAKLDQRQLCRVDSPVLIVQGIGDNHRAIKDSRNAMGYLNDQSRSETVDNTDHYFGNFENPNIEEQVLGPTKDWFLKHLLMLSFDLDSKWSLEI